LLEDQSIKNALEYDKSVVNDSMCTTPRETFKNIAGKDNLGGSNDLGDYKSEECDPQLWLSQGQPKGLLGSNVHNYMQNPNYQSQKLPHLRIAKITDKALPKVSSSINIQKKGARFHTNTSERSQQIHDTESSLYGNVVDSRNRKFSMLSDRYRHGQERSMMSPHEEPSSNLGDEEISR